MGVTLVKGANISLSDQAPDLKTVRVGLGWNARQTAGEDFDLDACCFMLTENGKVRNDADFIFYHQLKSTCGSVEHTGDNLTGDGEGDDEVLIVKLDKTPAEITKLVFSVTIYEYEKRKQNFGMVNDAYIRIVNNDNNEEIARFDLSEDASTNTAMIFGEIYRHNNKWKFRAVGQGFNHGLDKVATLYGVKIG
ncbi:MAG: TerD family protein [Planctomycetaceae bacterium]|jgi:tellurium resistance protein TerD|nr:TerD family protein [Planctomycetaceae bacterium]